MKAMNLLQFFFCHFMIVSIIGRQEQRTTEFSDYIPDHKYENFTLKLKMKDKVKSINLFRTDGILAKKKYLSVWITNENDDKLTKLNISEEIGEFTFYQDKCTKTAVVHYHKWNRIDGVISVNYYIKGLPFHKINEIHDLNSTYIHSRKREKMSSGIGLRQMNEIPTTIPANRNKTLKLYPELLVMMSYDMHKAIEKQSKLSYHVKTVLHILTELNAADMIFQTVKIVKIKLNIAGILLEGTQNKWGFETKRKIGTYYIDANTINSLINKYIRNKLDYFPRDSFDFVVYNTKKWLTDNSLNKLIGKSSVKYPDFSFPPHIPFCKRLNIAVKSHTTYEYYTTIVRKLTYLISATEDDDGELSYLFNITACKRILRNNGCAKNCFKWSQYAENGFEKSLENPAHCDLMNYPRSLSEPKPRITFSKHEQCQCYGHLSHVVTGNYISHDMCDKAMRCRTYDRAKISVPMPIDGTPCDKNKVCWNSSCVLINGQQEDVATL